MHERWSGKPSLTDNRVKQIRGGKDRNIVVPQQFSNRAAQWSMIRAKERAKISIQVSIHALRHCCLFGLAHGLFLDRASSSTNSALGGLGISGSPSNEVPCCSVAPRR